jgi:hypothetical protein
MAMDSASYRIMMQSKPHGKYAKKQGMMGWFRANGSSVDISIRKAVLHDFIEKLKPRGKIYKIAEILAIRLPAYICDLNSVELKWAKLKNLIISKTFRST